MVLFIIVYEEIVSIKEIMNVNNLVKNSSNIVKYCGIRRSLVQKLVMLLPDWLFKSSTRIVFIKSTPELNVSRELSLISANKGFDYLSDSSENDSDSILNNDSSIEMVQLISRQPDVIHNTSYNPYTGEISLDYKIKELEQELSKVREEIKEILFIINNKDQNSSLGFELPHIKEESTEENVVPPPAPPLPPLLYEIGYLRNKTPDRKVLKTVQSPEVCQKTLITMADVLKEMNKVKLKPIQRTPGGRPIRAVNTQTTVERTNVSPDLQAVLKRRFSAMHTISPITPQTPKIKRSSSEDSFCNNF